MNRVKFSFNAGDLIVLMASLSELNNVNLYQRINLPAYYFEGALHPVVDKGNNMVCCNEDIFERLYPLISYQEYIESFSMWTGQEVDYNMDETRDRKYIPMPYGDMYSWNSALFPEFQTDLSENWIDVFHNPEDWFDNAKFDFYRNKIIINRTERYTNPYISYFFLKPYEREILFSGTKKEHELFCDQWDLDLELLVTQDFLELARILSTSRFGIYNQSLHFHIAQSMHLPRILELCPQFPNTFIHGRDGYQFYYQKSLEYYFNKLIQ